MRDNLCVYVRESERLKQIKLRWSKAMRQKNQKIRRREKRSYCTPSSTSFHGKVVVVVVVTHSTVSIHLIQPLQCESLLKSVTFTAAPGGVGAV